MSDQNFILFKEYKKQDESFLLEIQLNNPAKLNVLNLEMILALNKKIKEYQNREDLSVVFIHSAGDKAFCAGGDVAQIYLKILENKKTGVDPALAAKDFFLVEYETDYLLYQFPKPIVLWGNGIVMGGGMGLFMAASHPIVTENSLLAMPEVSIGFFPDVGASYFLTQIQKNFGRYLALTACQLNACSADFLDLTKWAFQHKDKQNVFNFLKDTSFSNKMDFNNKFMGLCKKPQFLFEQRSWIEEFQKEITKALEFKDLNSFYDYLSQVPLEDQKWEKNRQNFLKASPSSLAVVSEQLKRAKKQTDLKSLFEMESVIALNLVRHSDFSEGVRALLVEKTKEPKWKPHHVDHLDPEEIEKYFIPEEGWDYSLKV